MKSDDIKKAPKLFAENIKLGYTPEYFVCAITSGANAQTYALTPPHAKRLFLYLKHELEAFEAQHGTINTTWSPAIPSPMQPKHGPTELS